MKVGATVPSQTMSAQFHNREMREIPGVCVYIHPKRRFYTLAYKLEGATIRESYPFQYKKGEDA